MQPQYTSTESHVQLNRHIAVCTQAWRPFKNWRRRLIVLEPDRLTWNRSPTEGSANGQVKPLMLSYFSNGMFLRT